MNCVDALGFRCRLLKAIFLQRAPCVVTFSPVLEYSLVQRTIFNVPFCLGPSSLCDTSNYFVLSVKIKFCFLMRENEFHSLNSEDRLIASL